VYNVKLLKHHIAYALSSANSSAEIEFGITVIIVAAARTVKQTPVAMTTTTPPLRCY